jgi:hypothetical protein
VALLVTISRLSPGFPLEQAGYATSWELEGDIKKELAMTKGLLVSLAILTLSTSAALAARRTHHRDAMNAFAAVPAPPVGWTGGVSSSDHTMHL